MQHYDVIIVGAGISGIGAAHHLATRCPQKSFTVLEARDDLGGTWDLFRYPGIRSDSDMYTLGFSFHPWTDDNAIADGATILSYLRDTARTFGIDQKVQFSRRVIQASWSSTQSRWSVTVRNEVSGDEEVFTCHFLWACTGYYSYDHGYTPPFEGIDEFEGTVVHPQHWPAEFDWSDKRVVVIGSGATAITLVPDLAREAAHVTMLQRSPSYVISRPQVDEVSRLLTRLAPKLGYAASRWKNVLLSMFFYEFSRRFPRQARAYLLAQVTDAIGDVVDVEKHFTPTYDPWDQRLCLVPDDDLFDAIRDGNVSVVTDHIERFTRGGVQLRGGDELSADVVVTATGLRVEFLGGATVEVDGEPVRVVDQMMYKGTMLTGVPNAAISIGYTNASWTLKVELSAEYVCRLLNLMDSEGYDRVVATPDPDVTPQPLIDFSSGYIQRAMDQLPRQGSRAPWRLYQNYFLDRITFRHSPIIDPVLKFSPARDGHR